MRAWFIVAALATILVAPLAQTSLQGLCCQFTAPAVSADDTCPGGCAQNRVVEASATCCSLPTTGEGCETASSCACTSFFSSVALLPVGAQCALPAATMTLGEEQVPVLTPAPRVQVGWDHWRNARPPPSLHVLYCQYLI